MKERPILMNGAMVRATLAGIKTQTRRILKKQPYESASNPPQFSDTMPGDLFVCPDHFPTGIPGRVITECEKIGVYHCMGQKEFAAKHSPYGQPGDRLYVRETFMDLTGTGIEPVTGSKFPWAYAADTPPGSYGDECRKDLGLKWKPSIHMPRTATRILLEIVGVRVERLNTINEVDAKAEGATPSIVGADLDHLKYRAGFQTLWESINGVGSWPANPWVWVVEFRRIK